ncbi:MAG TPA: histidine kinase [Bryobacteraceae bacterium]|nr:histidine kinase [Bryobacteraceae bacterium]
MNPQPFEMEQYLITLLVKIGVMAAIASFGVRSRRVKRMLRREERTLDQRFRLALWFIALFLPGVAIRVITKGNYRALDLGFEGSLLAGITGGYFCGWVAGMAISLPAMRFGEILSLPIFALAGLGGGLLRDSARDVEDIWRFSPFPDVNFYRIFQPGRELRSALLHAYFTVGVLVAEALRQLLGGLFFVNLLFTLTRWGDWPAQILGLLATYFSITLPLKVWNNTRTEAKLEEHQGLLMQARLDALTSQINPHFLFNTLNSISTLIRINPDQARTMLQKLSRILRRRLKNQDHFSPLRDELEFIEDYLSIEIVRFGDKLRIAREIDPAVSDMLVPSMLLQPLVENSIRHGLAGKVDGGTVTLRARRKGDWLSIEIEDDGVGIAEEELAAIGAKGIGVSNVRERLKVLYNQNYRMKIDSQPGRGTRIEIEVPEIQHRMAVVS